MPHLPRTTDEPSPILTSTRRSRQPHGARVLSVALTFALTACTPRPTPVQTTPVPAPSASVAEATPQPKHCPPPLDAAPWPFVETADLATSSGALALDRARVVGHEIAWGGALLVFRAGGARIPSVRIPGRPALRQVAPAASGFLAVLEDADAFGVFRIGDDGKITTPVRSGDPLVISPDGQRFARLAGGELLVGDVEGGAVTHRVPLPAVTTERSAAGEEIPDTPRLLFANESMLGRPTDDGIVSAGPIVVATRKWTRVHGFGDGRLLHAEGPGFSEAHARGGTLVLVDPFATKLLVVDAETGKVRRTLRHRPHGGSMSSGFSPPTFQGLVWGPDESLVVVVLEPGGFGGFGLSLSAVVAYRRDGREIGRTSGSLEGSPKIVGEGALLRVVSRDPKAQPTCRRIDLQTGRASDCVWPEPAPLALVPRVERLAYAASTGEGVREVRLAGKPVLRLPDGFKAFRERGRLVLTRTADCETAELVHVGIDGAAGWIFHWAGRWEVGGSFPAAAFPEGVRPEAGVAAAFFGVPSPIESPR